MSTETTNKYITVAYKLYVPTENGAEMLQEEATKEHPFQFISGMGLTLDAFEDQIANLEKGTEFDFTLSVEQAYGVYVDEAVQSVPRKIFEIDGKLNEKYIYEGAVVPLMNNEGERFNGTITAIGANEITVDLNHPLAGKTLRFAGTVTENREATNQEIQEMVQSMTGGGCGGCGGEEGCGGEGSCRCGNCGSC